MKVKIPQKIKIGTHCYSLSFTPHIHCDEGRYANCNHRTQEIQFWAEAPRSITNESLIHEVLHIAELFQRIEVSDPDIDRIANVIMILLKDNLGIEFDWSDIEDNPA